MRLDALIIFHIEWQHQVSSLVGKQSKYWSKKGKTENDVRSRLMTGKSTANEDGKRQIYCIIWRGDVTQEGVGVARSVKEILHKAV